MKIGAFFHRWIRDMMTVICMFMLVPNNMQKKSYCQILTDIAMA